MDLTRKTLRGSLFLFFFPLFLFIFTSLIFSNCATKKEKEKKQLVVIKDEFEKVEVEEFVLDEKTGQELAKNQILIYIVGNSKSELEEKKTKVSEFLKAKKGEFSILGEIEFLSEKGKVGVLLQGKVPSGTPEEIKQIVSELRNFDGNVRAFPNVRMKPSAILGGYVPLDPLFDSWEETPGGNNWHFEAVNMPGLWKMETEGKVPVAVIEFGIRKHEDLEYELRRGVDGEGADWAQNHGVSVLGVLGAVGNNSKGIAGAIWRGNIKAYVIDGTLSGLVQNIISALQDGAKVILFAGGLEWGNVNPVGNPEAEAILEYHRQIFSIVFQYVRYYDALFVQSAGNENQDAYWSGVGASVKDLFPHNILLVGSTNILGKISSFSNKGSLVDIYLPGENIFTTCAGEGGNNNSDNRYCSVSGTSYSAALGAGVAVLLKSINQNLRSGDIKNLILSGVRVEGEGYEARYFIDFSISANNALQAIPSETDVFSEPFPELPFILKGGFLAPKAVACAVYDNTTADGDKAYNTPKCLMDEDGCSSCGLLDGIGSSEPNSPNVIAGTCSGADQPGTDPVRIISIQIDSLAESGFIEPGKNIKVFVRAWCNNNNQWVDVLTSPNPDAASPTFSYLGSWRCDCGAYNGWTSSSIVGSVICGRVPSGSGYEVSIRFVITLPTVLGKMAIRARIQNSNAARTGGCYTTSSIRDHDDLVFTIQNPPSGFSCGVYNSSFQAPVCYGDGWCGTCNTVICRDTVNDTKESPQGFSQCPNGGNEPNSPNTLFSQCPDGSGNDHFVVTQPSFTWVNAYSCRIIGAQGVGTNLDDPSDDTLEGNVSSACAGTRICGIDSKCQDVHADPPPTDKTYDDCTYQENMPFTFPFYGQNFSRVCINSNGLIYFTTGTCSPGWWDFGHPSAKGPDYSIAVVWKDLDPLTAISDESCVGCGYCNNIFCTGEDGHYGELHGFGSVFKENRSGLPCPTDASRTCRSLIITWYELPDFNVIGDSVDLCTEGSRDWCATNCPCNPDCEAYGGCTTVEGDADNSCKRICHCCVDACQTRFGTYKGQVGNRNTFQVILWEDGTIDINVRKYTSTSQSAYMFLKKNSSNYRVLNVGAGISSNTSYRIYPLGGDTDDKLLDEQVRRINVKSLAPSGKFEGGELVEVSALVPCYTKNNQIILAYASGVTYSPSAITNWRYLDTISCPEGSATTDWHVMRYTFRLDNVEGWHAVRVVQVYCNNCSPIRDNICPYLGPGQSGFRDADDFVFYVRAVPPSDLPVCATYDNTTADGDPAYMTPKCPAGASACSTCDLVKSRDNIPGTSEPGQPNTLSTTTPCSDDPGSAPYLKTESIERIQIRDLSGRGTFSPGERVEVGVVVYCDPVVPYYYNDYLVVLYSSNADSPSWQRILTATCSSPGYQFFKTQINLDTHTGVRRHVIRAMFKYGPFSSSQVCAGGSGQDGDTDDLVFIVGVPAAPENFKVQGVWPDTITLSWNDVLDETVYELRWTDNFTSDFSRWQALASVNQNTTWYSDRPLPEGTYRCYAIRACNANGCSSFVWDCATVPSLSANCAIFDSTWRVPRCDGGVNNCSTCDLIVSRDSLPSKQEQNTPNAWYSSSCVDGTGGDWFLSRSIERIILSTNNIKFERLYSITVTIQVFCTSPSDWVHFYVSQGTSTILFQHIDSSQCSSSGVENKTFTYVPNANDWYVIRAVVTGSAPSSCPGGLYDEVDDVAVRVGDVPQAPSDFIVFVIPDKARVVWSDVAGATYYRLVSAPSPSGPFTVDSDYSGSVTYHDHPGLQDGQSLCFRVQACNALGCSAFTPVKCVTVAPNPPDSMKPVTAYSSEAMGTNAKYIVKFRDTSTNEDGFIIEMTSDGQIWTKYEWWVGSSVRTTTGDRSVEISLPAETRWCFRVASFKQNPQVGTITLSDWADNTTKCVIGVRAPYSLYAEGLPKLRTLRFFWQGSSYDLGQSFDWRPSGSSTFNSEIAFADFYEKQFPTEEIYCARVTNWWYGDNSKPEEQGSYSVGYSSELCKLAVGVPSPLYLSLDGTTIRIDWQDNATQETGYVIQVSSGLNWSDLQNLPPNSSNFSWTPGPGRYCFRVRAQVGGLGYSDWTEVRCISFGATACSLIDTPTYVGASIPIRAVLSDGDSVFAAYGDKVLSASKLNEVSVKWVKQLGSAISSNICSVSTDRILLGDTGGKVYILSKANGAILAETTLTGSIVGCSISSRGEIFVTTNAGYIYKLNLSLNVLGFVNEGASASLTAPAIDERYGNVIVPGGDGVLRIYDTDLSISGSATINLGTPLRSGVAIGPKREEVYVGGDNGYLYRVTKAGTNLFAKSVNVGGAIRTSPVVYQYGAEVTVIVGLDTGVLKAYGVDSSGNFVPLWSQSLGGVPTGAPVLAGDVVFIGVGNQIQARKVSDGTAVGGSCPYTALGSISTALDVEGSDIVFGDETGRLYIIAGGGGESKGWWVSYNMKGKRAIGGIYTHRGLAYEEARYCPYSPTSSGYIFSVIAEEIRSDYAGREIFAFDNKGWRGYLISATGQIIWEVYLGWRSWSLPAVGDIIPGGSKEIAMGMEDARVVVLRSDGGWYQILLCGGIRAVTLADVDGNGDDEIIATSQGCNKTYVIDWDEASSSLKLLREYGLSSDSGNNSYGVWYGGKIYVAGFSGNLYMFDYANYSTSVVSVAGSSVRLHTPAIGDVDGDGVKEVIVGGDNGVIYIRNLDGTAKGSVDIRSYTGGVGKCMNRISLGDADRDGKDEIYVVASDCTATTGNSYLVSITYFGGVYQVRWGRGPFRGTSSSHVVIGDFDGDGMGDIATVVHYDDLYIWRWDGSMNFVGRAYYSGGGARGGMSVIDLDEDGRQNIIFGDRSSGCVHIFEFGEGTASGEVWWGYNRANPKQNGVR